MSDRRPLEPVAGEVAGTHTQNRQYFPALDGYRAIAFLLVFGTHYLYLPWGATGVDAFFVLSGFLITGILFDTRDDPHRARNFYIRRTLRIFPLYYGVLLLTVLVYPVMRWSWSWVWLVWPAYLGNYLRFVAPYANNSWLQQAADAQLHSRAHPLFVLYFGHFWSLCVEEQFYLVWPWVVFMVKDRRALMWICALSIPVCTALRVLHAAYLPGWMYAYEVTARATPLRLDALLCGGLIALAMRGPHAKLLAPAARVCASVLLSGFVLWHVFAAGPESQRYVKYVAPSWSATWGLTATEMFYGSVLILTVQYGSVLYRILTVRPLRWIGRISYGAYVFHDVLHIEFLRLALRFKAPAFQYVAAALALPLTLLVAWLSYRYFETPFIRLKERWT